MCPRQIGLGAGTVFGIYLAQNYQVGNHDSCSFPDPAQLSVTCSGKSLGTGLPWGCSVNSDTAGQIKDTKLGSVGIYSTRNGTGNPVYLPNPDPYPTSALTNPNFWCCVFQLIPKLMTAACSRPAGHQGCFSLAKLHSMYDRDMKSVVRITVAAIGIAMPLKEHPQ